MPPHWKSYFFQYLSSSDLHFNRADINLWIRSNFKNQKCQRHLVVCRYQIVLRQFFPKCFPIWNSDWKTRWNPNVEPENPITNLLLVTAYSVAPANSKIGILPIVYQSPGRCDQEDSNVRMVTKCTCSIKQIILIFRSKQPFFYSEGFMVHK